MVSHTGTIHEKFIYRISTLNPGQEISFSNPVANKEIVAAAIVYLQTINRGSSYTNVSGEGDELIRVTRIT